MKLLNTEYSVISLENVRYAELLKYESKHTSKGNPYITTDYTVYIHYIDGFSMRVECGKDEQGLTTAKLTLDKIYSILSEKE